MKYCAGLFMLLCSLFLFSDDTAAQSAIGEMPGNTTATDTPTIFATGIVSDGLGNRDMAISPDGNEMFYTVQSARGSVNVLMHLVRISGQWQQPEVASFSGVYGDLEPAFSPDGTRLYFTSARPISDTSHTSKDFDIWYVPRIEGKWQKPINLGSTVNSSENEFYPSVSRNGNVYFTREIKGGKGSEDIVVCRYLNGIYSEPESLSDSINTAFDEFNAFVDPDEKFLIFSRYGGKDNGGGDLYISWKNNNGAWGLAKDLPAPLNSKSLDYCPFVSADKQYLFFTSNRSLLTQPFAAATTRQQLIQRLTAPGNGLDDIYWIKFSVIQQLK